MTLLTQSEASWVKCIINNYLQEDKRREMVLKTILLTKTVKLVTNGLIPH